MDFDFSISWCERVSEWTLSAHWLSEISPWKTCAICPKAAAISITTPTLEMILFIFNLKATQ